MSESKIAKHRYPGIQPFGTHDQQLFNGREKEIYDLLYLLKVKRLTVLFGKSGIGKTSLLNAGVFPLLAREDIYPILVRFQDTDTSPLNSIVKQLEPFVNKELLLSHTNYTEDEATLWEYVKACEFSKKGYTLLLVFDQFEEFFLHTKRKREHCTAQLADLVHERLPDNIRQQLRKIPRKGRTKEQLEWYQPLNSKLLCLIRSDKLSLMDEMTVAIPSILKTRFHLLPLQKEEATHAIRLPSQVLDRRLATQPFEYADKTIALILKHLSNKENEVECFQLQILCQHIEQAVKNKQAKGATNVIVTPDYLGGETGIQDILNNYYENQLSQITNKSEQQKARKLIEEGLIFERRRIGVDEEVAMKQFKVNKKLLDKLLKTRLVRVEKNRFGRAYEVSHDSLVAPILKSYEKRQLDEASRKMTRRVGLIFIGLFLFGLMSSTALYQYYWQQLSTIRIQKDREVKELKEEHTETLLEQGDLFITKGQEVKAIEQYSKALEYTTDSLVIAEKIASIDIKAIESATAKGVEDKLPEISKERLVNTFNYLAKEQKKTGDFEEAEESYEKALTIDTAAYESLVQYGDLMAKQQKPQKADELLTSALHQSPNTQEEIKILNKLSEINLKNNQLDKATEYSELAIDQSRSLSKENPLLYIQSLNESGKLYLRKKDFHMADQSFRLAHKLLNDLVVDQADNEVLWQEIALTNIHWGQLFHRKRDYPEAEIRYKEALELLNWDNLKTAKEEYLALCYYNYGLLFFDQNKFADADEYYGKALTKWKDLAKSNPRAFDLEVCRASIGQSQVYYRWYSMNKLKNAIYKTKARLLLISAQKRLESFEELPETVKLRVELESLLKFVE